MKIFLVIDETSFYQPNYVADLLRNSNHDFVGAALISKIPKKSSLEYYLLKHFYYLKTQEILKLSFKWIRFKICNFFFRKHINANFYSVRAVFKHFRIDFFEVKNNINTKEHIAIIKSKKPEIILSSNSLYFHDEILGIAKYCINRHSSLLPAYGGLWPIFQALKNCESTVGVSIHHMSKKIDGGQVIFQEEIIINDNDTVDSLYQKAFKISSVATLQAIDAIEKGYNKSIQKKNIPSYYSFPTKKDWIQFRKLGKKFI